MVGGKALSFGLGVLDARLQCAELIPDLGRNAAAQEVEPLGVVFHIASPVSGVDGQRLADILDVEVQALDVDVLSASGVAHDSLDGVDLAFDAVHDPLQDAGVLAEARPQEAAVFAAAEPVNQEDGRHAVTALDAHVDPVLQVVTSVVADERQHRHWIVAQCANLALGSCSLARSQKGADHGAVIPAECLGDQRNGVRAAAAEQDGVDLDTLPVVELRCGSWALRNRDTVAGVRVSSLCGGFRGPVVAVPVDEVRRSVAHLLPPDIAVVGQRDVGEQGVARLHGLHGDRVGIVVGAWRHAEEAVLRVHGVKAVLAQVQPRDVVTHNFRRPARDGRGDHGEVGLATSRRESRRNVVVLALRVGQLQDEHVLSHPALFFTHNRSDAQRVALLGQDGVSAVARAVGPDFLGLWELGDVLGVVARPSHILLARLQWSTHGVQCVDEIALSTNLLQRLCAHTGHDAHGQDHVRGVSELDTQLRVRIVDRPHAKRNHVHGAALHGAAECLGHLCFHGCRRCPVVGGASAFLGLRADEGAGLNTCDVRRVRASEVRVRTLFLVQLDEGALFHKLRCETFCLFLGAVDEDHSLRLE